MKLKLNDLLLIFFKQRVSRCNIVVDNSAYFFILLFYVVLYDLPLFLAAIRRRLYRFRTEPDWTKSSETTAWSMSELEIPSLLSNAHERSFITTLSYFILFFLHCIENHSSLIKISMPPVYIVWEHESCFFASISSSDLIHGFFFFLITFPGEIFVKEMSIPK